MGFFDKVTKAVGDVVDKGKKDIDQFMHIQKINGEISAIEARVAELKAQGQQTTLEAGGKAIALLRAGSLASPDLQVFVDKLAGFEQQIAAELAAVAAKKADIERLKAEHEAEHATAAPAAAPAQAAAAQPLPPAVPPAPPAAPAAAVPMAPPPLPQAARACPQCGKPLTGGAFCTECGAKVS
jgi:hypothetical protein